MKRISKEKATQLISKGATLVDMRSPVSFRDGHIQGAVNLPLKNFTNMLMATPNKEAKFVLYGHTTQDADILHGMNYAEQLGFSNMYVTDYETLR